MHGAHRMPLVSILPMHTLEKLRAGRLAGIRRLDLSCGLAEFPDEVFSLADSLEVLNLSGNLLQDLPADLSRLHRLRVLFCSDNRFTHVPATIGACTGLHTLGFKANRIDTLDPAALPPSLRALILTDNRLEHLPEGVSRCTGLLKLMLSGNRLDRLPGSLSACGELELLRIAANRFESLPAWLGDLPRLSWLACGGNPFGEDHGDDTDAAPTIDWRGLELGPRLGEGASGVIHRALWRPGASEAPQPVALKLFKGRMTSDGLPHSEMAACLRAGAHPHLIGALGRVGGHPEGAPGLVMPLVDPAFQVLAGPPSLDSCTRDVYAPQTRLAPRAMGNLALGVARAVAHLHARGILHGDLYAHNILWDGGEGVLLGDFGAAALLPGGGAAGAAWQRLEVRAFGCLLEELLACGEGAVADADDGPRVQALAALRQRCMHPDPASRPLFGEIVTGLEAIGAGR
jgi:hypothetical protein